MKQPDEIYREKLASIWGIVASVVFIGVSLLFLFLFFYQQAHGPIGDKPALDWFFIMMFCIFLLVGLLLANFSFLTTVITTHGITAGFGIFRYRILWDNIAGCEIDKGSAFLQYGGYGIRCGRKNSNSALVYNVMFSPLVVIQLKNGKYKYFGLSTKHPEKLTELITSHKR
jgi:hypothetical protein